ncbi:MAG: RuvX/YqgF family protein [Chloroflexota bacterium]
MRWMCLDPGEKRTGVALSSPEETFAVPLTVLEHGPDGPSMAQLDALRQEHRVDAILIGVPVSMDNTLSVQSRFAIALACRVAGTTGVPLVLPAGMEFLREALPSSAPYVNSINGVSGTPVVLWDERLSTWSARVALRERGQSSRRRGSRPARLDAHAAAMILQSYFDSRERPGEPEEDQRSLSDED